MSLGVDPDNNLFCVWTGFNSSDHSDEDFADHYYCNGDLYMSYSMDGGTNWAQYENITNTQTPNCQAGDCDSENWATLAESVDDYLRVFYVWDKDAGAAPIGEGEATNNPMIYLEIPNPTMTNLKLKIFDIVGRLVETLADAEFPAGENSVLWDAENHSSGVYFSRLSANTYTASKKLVLLK